jgi:hypothetical protein
MFPLHTKTLPTTAAELATVLNAALSRLFSGTSEPVSIRGHDYPEIAELEVSLSGAELRKNPPPKLRGSSKPALSVGALRVHGSAINVGPVSVNLDLEAEAVRLDEDRDTNDDVVLVLASARNGHVEVSAPKDTIEEAIAEIAKQEAGKHGVTIESVHLMVTARGVRGMDAQVELKAKKLFFNTVIQIAASLDVDNDLNATLSGVRCTGEGAIGGVACGFLNPHLQKVDGRTVSLMALPLGEIRLRDVTLSANERLTVRAEFSS